MSLPRPKTQAQLDAEKAFLSLFNEVTEESHDTSQTPKERNKARAEARGAYEARAGYRTPTSELTARIEAAERVVWIPNSYVLFVRLSTCKTCHSTDRCLDIPRLFLQQRKQRRDESNPYLYTPVREIEHWTLPRRIVVNPVSVPYCLNCFEGVVCQELSGSSQGVSESRIADLEKRLEEPQMVAPTPLQEETALLSSQGSHSLPSTSQAESAGSPSETEFGSVCGEREFGQPATAVE